MQAAQVCRSATKRPNYALKRTVRDEVSSRLRAVRPARPLSLGVRQQDSLVIYLTYGQVPELKSVPREEWRSVLIGAGGAFGKTKQFWYCWWLTMFLSFGLGSLGALLAYLHWHESTAAALAFTITGLVGYTIGFSVRTHNLRPHIRQFLASRSAA